MHVKLIIAWCFRVTSCHMAYFFSPFAWSLCPQATSTIFLRHFTNCVFADCSDWKCEIENAIASRNSADQTFFWKTWPWKQASLAVLPKNPGGVWDDCCLDLGRVHQGFVNPHVLHSGRKSCEHWQLQTLVVRPATGQDSKFSAGHPQGGWHSFQTFYQPLGNMTKYAQIIPHKYPNTSYWSVQ